MKTFRSLRRLVGASVCSQVLVLLVAGRANAQGRLSGEFGPQQLESVSIAPGRDAKHLTVMFTAKAGVSLPRTFVAMINDKEVQVTGDGRGHFMGAVESTEDARRVSPTTFEISNNGRTLRKKTSTGPVTKAPKGGGSTITCTVETVECPKDCKSSIFGAPCIICLKIKCTIKL